MKLKFYNLIAIIGFILFIIGCFAQNTNTTLIGIGFVMIMIPATLYDETKRNT